MNTALFDKPEQIEFSNTELLIIMVMAMLIYMIYIMLNIMVKIDANMAAVGKDKGIDCKKLSEANKSIKHQDKAEEERIRKCSTDGSRVRISSNRCSKSYKQPKERLIRK